MDIDRQAVEVTKLSLLLKVLEGENQETLGRQLALWRERALPDLASNVKCGNSLIGPDYFEGQLMPDEEEMRRVNPFDWRAEFPEIMAAGGFDVVIGNPPYRKERESRELLADLRNSSYGKLHYQGKMDYWYFFLHRAIDVTKPSGHISFIVPSYWLKSSGASKLISRVRKECAFIDAVDFGKSKVFSQVSGLHMVFVLIKGVRHQKLSYQRYTATNLSPSEIQEVLRTRCVLRSQVDLLDSESIFTEDDEIDFERQQYLGFLTKLEQNSFPLERGERIFEVSQGIVEAPNIISAQMARKAKMPHLAGEGVFVVGRSVIESYAFNLHEKPFIKKYLRPEDVTRYHYEFGEYYVFYIGSRDNKGIIANQGKYPNIVKHLGQYREFITSSNAPFGIHRTRKHHFFVSERLLCPNMFDKPSFTYCQDEYYVNFSFNVIIRGVSTYSLKYLLGILNSSLGAFWFDLHAKKRGVNNDVGVGIMRRFPVHSINFDDPADVARHDKMVALVERMLDLHKKLAIATIPADKTLYQRQIEATDRQIDALVYELYGLTEEEIAIVEGRS